jgi:hypothetical protein
MPFPNVIADTVTYVVTSERLGEDHRVSVTDHGEESVWVPPSFYNEVGDKAFLFFKGNAIFEVLEAIDRAGDLQLSDVAQTTSGFGGKSSMITDARIDHQQIPVIKGADIGYYSLIGCHYFIFADENLTGRTRDERKLTSGLTGTLTTT